MKSYLSNHAPDIRNNALRQLNEALGLAWNALDNANAQLPIAQQYADLSDRVRSVYQQQFSLGERSLLDLFDSENETFTAQRRLIGSTERTTVDSVPNHGDHWPATQKPERHSPDG